MNYPEYSAELADLLLADQDEKKKLGEAFFHDPDKMQTLQKTTRTNAELRVNRALEILDAIGEPSISNIGLEGTQALSVLAVHTSIDNLKKLLVSFMKVYEHQRDECYFQAIPSMTDRLLILEGKPQRFGTQWMFDANKYPFLPTVEDFEHVNERRAEYQIEPLRWPKSLAIPESEQPWLKQPLSKAIIRQPTKTELADFRS